MPEIFICCPSQRIREDLASRISRLGYTVEACSSVAESLDRISVVQPHVVVLYPATHDQLSGMEVSIVRYACRDAKIIYATSHPSKRDVEFLEQGIFYYAGNASSEEVVEAVKAAMTRKNRGSETPQIGLGKYSKNATRGGTV